MNKALFLDRDGIINIDHGYVYQKENFDFVKGIFDICRSANEKGYIIIVITNQSGIGRGKYSETDFKELTAWMVTKFKEQGILIKDVYFCPHHPTNALDDYLMQCECRKPAPGMIIKAAQDHQIALNQSIFIGDKVSDIQAAEAAGIKNRILVASQYQDKVEIKAQKVDSVTQVEPYIV